MSTSVRSAGWLLLWCGMVACTGRVYRDLEPTLQTYEARPQADVRSWFLRAAVAEHRGEIPEADAAWRWVLRLEDSGWTRLGHGAYLERQGRWDDAIDAYRRALEHDPSLDRARLGIGRVLVGRGQDADAEPWLREAGTLPDALHILGRLYLRRGDEDAAREVLSTWMAQQSMEPEARLRRARLAASLGRHHQAVDDLVVVLESPTASAVTGALLVDEARRACRIGTAWTWARDRAVAQRSDPDWRHLALEIGLAAGDPGMVEAAARADELLAPRMELLARQGRAEHALALARAASEAHPGNPEPQIRAGMLLSDLGRHEQALQAWQGVDDRSVAVERAASLLALGRLDEAASEVASLDGSRAAWLRARILLARGDLEAAEAEVRGEPDRWRLVASLRREAGDLDGALKALDHAGDDPRSLRQVARLSEAAGRTAAALEAWRALVSADPGDADGWVAVARMDPAAAPEAVTHALEADPCHVDALLARAEMLDGCEAIAPLERAVEAAPLDPDVLRDLGDAYHGCGRIEGLRWVEQSWRVLGDEEAAERLAGLRRELEP